MISVKFSVNATAQLSNLARIAKTLRSDVSSIFRLATTCAKPPPSESSIPDFSTRINQLLDQFRDERLYKQLEQIVVQLELVQKLPPFQDELTVKYTEPKLEEIATISATETVGTKCRESKNYRATFYPEVAGAKASSAATQSVPATCLMLFIETRPYLLHVWRNWLCVLRFTVCVFSTPSEMIFVVPHDNTTRRSRHKKRTRTLPFPSIRLNETPMKYLLLLCFFGQVASISVSEEIARVVPPPLRWGNRAELPAEELEFDLWWQISKYVGGNQIIWKNVNHRIGETMVLNEENYGPRFRVFARLLTDGLDFASTFQFVLDYGTSYTRSGHGFSESYLFGNETGCTNGIDLQGNYIESVALTIDTFDVIENKTMSSSFDSWYDMNVNLSLVVSGRPALPEDHILAVVTDDADAIYCPSDENCSRTVWLTVSESSLWWAELEFAFELNEGQQTDTFSTINQYGNYPIQELLTSGVDGDVTVGQKYPDGISRSFGKPKSIKFGKETGCFNGFDFEGNLVEGVSLQVEREGDLIQPSFVIWGVLMDPPPEPATPAPTLDSHASHSNLISSLLMSELIIVLLVV